MCYYIQIFGLLFILKFMTKCQLLITLCLCLFKIATSTLQFEITDKPKCFIEEFYHDGVALIKWKIIGFEGEVDLDGTDLV